MARPRALAGPIARLPLPWAAVDPRDDSVGAALRSPAEGSLDEAQQQATGDMPPAERRAALHAAADLVADYLEEVERYAVLPPSSPASSGDRLDGPPPEEPVASRGDPARRAQRGRPQRHALAASRLLRLLPLQRLDHRPARRARLERPQCQRLPVAHVAGGRGARGHHGRLAARRPGPAAELRRRLQRHGLDQQPGGSRRRSPARHRRRLAGRPRGLGAAADPTPRRRRTPRSSGRP